MASRVYHFQLRVSNQFTTASWTGSEMRFRKSQTPIYTVDMRYVSADQVSRMRQSLKSISRRGAPRDRFAPISDPAFLMRMDARYSAYQARFEKEIDRAQFLAEFGAEATTPSWLFQVHRSRTREITRFLNPCQFGLFDHLKFDDQIVVRVHDAATAVALKMILSEDAPTDA